MRVSLVGPGKSIGERTAVTGLSLRRKGWLSPHRGGSWRGELGDITQGPSVEGRRKLKVEFCSARRQPLTLLLCLYLTYLLVLLPCWIEFLKDQDHTCYLCTCVCLPFSWHLECHQL